MVSYHGPLNEIKTHGSLGVPGRCPAGSSPSRSHAPPRRRRRCKNCPGCPSRGSVAGAHRQCEPPGSSLQKLLSACSCREGKERDGTPMASSTSAAPSTMSSASAHKPLRCHRAAAGAMRKSAVLAKHLQRCRSAQTRSRRRTPAGSSVRRDDPDRYHFLQHRLQVAWSDGGCTRAAWSGHWRAPNDHLR